MSLVVMERQIRLKSILMFFLLIELVSQSMIAQVLCRSLEVYSNQKNYYHVDPHVGNTPKYSHANPSCPPPSGGGSQTPSPSHRGKGSEGSPTPSHGTGSSHGIPTPSDGGGGYYNSPPSGGGHSAPAIIIPPPSTPVVAPPATPTPAVPDYPAIPSPPIPDSNSPPADSTGTCSYWIKHPEAIKEVLGYWVSVGQIFGAACSSAFGKQNLSLLEALGNTRGDGIGALFREGTASLLNSMANKNKKFPFTPQQVKVAFAAAAATSDGAAAAQAEIFKQANEGQLQL